MQKLIWVAGLAFLAAVGPAAAAPATIEEAREQWRLCIQRKIEALDDGISTASDIAGGVQNFCQAEYLAMASTVKLTPGMLNEITADRANSTKQVAQELVLEVRAARRLKASTK